jgi:hypothetical protein
MIVYYIEDVIVENFTSNMIIDCFKSFFYGKRRKKNITK